MTIQLPLTLRVAAASMVAESTRELVLVRADGGPLPGWQPGAHIDLEAGAVVRQYSLCGEPARADEWRVAVLRDPASRGGSAFLVESLVVGAEIRAGGPRNNFQLERAESYLFIAGGIGITPMLPMFRQVVASGTRARFVYGARNEAAMSYREELITLGGDAVEFYPQDRHGMLDLSRLLRSVDRATVVYCCGPEGLLAAVEAQCDARGIELRLERFAPRPLGAVIDRPVELTLADSGITLTVPPEQTILDAVQQAGVFVLSNCEEGTCGTCITNVLDGVPEHRDSYLSDEEQASNDVMMICVSRAKSARLTLDL